MAVRKVKRRNKEVKRQRWSQIAIGAFLILLMVVSIAQVSLDQNSNSKTAYHGTRFKLTPDGFTAKVAGQEERYEAVPFSDQNGTVLFQSMRGGVVVLVPAPGVGALLKNAEVIALTFDPLTSPEVASFLDLVRLDLTQAFPNVVNGMLENVSAYRLPLINCSMASPRSPVIKLLIANTTRTGLVNVSLNGSCVTVSGDGAGLVAATAYLRLARDGVMSAEKG